MFKLFNSSSRTHASKPAQKRRATRLRMESLEDRVVMADGGLDGTFGTGGVVSFASNTKWTSPTNQDHWSWYGWRYGPVFQSSGKFLTASQDLNDDQVHIYRFNADGSTDTGFGTSGSVTIPIGTLSDPTGTTDRLNSFQVQPNDDKLLIAGNDATTDANVGNLFNFIRLTADGAYDKTFGSNGRIEYNAGYSANLKNIAVQADGKIVAVGYSAASANLTTNKDFYIMRLNTDGSLDSSFGEPTTTPNLKSGRLRLAQGIEEYANGAEYATQVMILPDSQKILVLGLAASKANPSYFNMDPTFVRLNPDGSFDTTFGTNGIKNYVYNDFKLFPWGLGIDIPLPLMIQPISGRLILAANICRPNSTTAGQFGLFGFKDNGSFDTTFGTNGVVRYDVAGNTQFSDLLSAKIQRDDKILVGGWCYLPDNAYCVSRFLPTGQIDKTFGNAGDAIYNYKINDVDEGEGLAIQPSDGKILLLGVSHAPTYWRHVITRFTNTLPAKCKTTFSLTCSSSSSNAGSELVYTFTASPATAYGTVDFLDENNQKIGSATLSAGTGTFRYSGLAAGQHSITAFYNGNYVFDTSSSSALPITVIPKPSSIALNLSTSNSLWASDVTLTAALTPSLATGSVQFFDGNTPIGSAISKNGLASLVVNSLDVGTHSITARYSGDNTYAAALSTAQALVITQAASVVGLTLSKTTAEYGQQVDLTANLSPSLATGTVVFRDDTTELGRIDLTNGRAVLSLNNFALGSHPITVEYLGTPNLTGSSSAVQNLVIQQASTSLALVATPATVGYRAPLKLTATAASAGGSVAGSIRFMDGSTELGSVPLANGKAELLIDQKISPLASGNHSIQAIYDASGVFAGSSSTAVVVKVLSAISPTIALTASPNQSLIGQGQKITFTVKLTSPSGTPTGLVDLLDNGAPLQAGVPVVNGTATFTTSNLPIGTHSIQANYLGDTLFGPVASATAVNFEIIQPVSTTTTLAVDPASLAFAMPVTLTATIAAATPPTGGTVDFYDGSKKLGQASLSANGTASLPLAGLGVGSHALKAVYSGFERFIASQSVVSTVSVDKATSSTTLSLSATQVVWGSGTPRVDLTAQVDGPGQSTSGTVSFFRGTLLLGSAALANGAAILTTNQLQLGDNSITARYDGDLNYLASESSPGTVKVLGQTTVSLQASPIPVIVGKPLTLTANVLSAQGNPEGTVEFWEGGTSLGQATLVGGIAKLAISSLAIGQHSFVAKYNPAASSPFAANNSPAASASVTDIPGSAIASLNIVRSGTRIIRIELVANGPLDKLTAETLANYTMVYAGRDGKFGTKDDVKINLAKSKLSYNPATNVITLTPPGGKLALTGTARLTIANLKDNLGRPFDGDRNGLPGGVCNVLVTKTGTYLFA